MPGAGRPLLASLALLVALAVPLSALAQSFPALTGRVVDVAEALTGGERAALAEKLAAHEEATADQVVVATVPSLEGVPIDAYANQLFRLWGLGRADRDNGVLVLVAPGERQMRIEVGYGLESVLTDALAGAIVHAVMLPHFRRGDVAAGLAAGTDAVLSILSGDGQAWQGPAAAFDGNASRDIFFGFLVLVLLATLVAFLLAGPPARRRRRDGWGLGGSARSGSGSGGGYSGGGGSSGGAGASARW